MNVTDSAVASTVCWGTNREGGPYYAGRVHAVWPGRRIAVCELPVADIWPQRPVAPELLCPDCCVLVIGTLFPPVLLSPQQLLAHWPHGP